MTTKASSTVCRTGLAIAGRRCRTAAPVAWPLVQRGVDASRGRSEPGAWPSSARGYARPAAMGAAVAHRPAAATAAAGDAASMALRPLFRDATGNSISGRGKAWRVLSTSADSGDDTNEDASAPAGASAGGDGKGGGDGVESQEGAAAAAAGDGEAAPAPEDDPLEGVVADDGDPGPPPPLDPSIVTEPSPKVLEVMASIDALNFVEVAMLIDVFKNKLGLDEVPTLNTGGGGDGESDSEGDGGAAAGDAKKTVFKVKVTGFGDKAKIKVIKEVRVVTGLGLREAKEMVENLPKVVKEDLKEDEAEALKATLEAAGATVELE